MVGPLNTHLLRILHTTYAQGKPIWLHTAFGTYCGEFELLTDSTAVELRNYRRVGEPGWSGTALTIDTAAILAVETH